MRTNELAIANARMEHLRAEAADRRMAAMWQNTTGRPGLVQVWSAVRATLTSVTASPSVSR